MNSIKIKPSNIRGSIKVSGSKNSALPIIVGALLNEKNVVLSNVANISDINELLSIITDLGCACKFKRDKLKINCSGLLNKDILYDSCKKIRASYYLMGLYLAKYNHVKIKLPGGCDIGERPIDYHLMGFEALGCKYKINDDVIEIALIRPTPAVINLPKKSLGATINLVLLASSIEGKTIINNISIEPELIDFLDFMINQGVDIVKKGNTLIINGGKRINKKVKYKIIPDRIEASTFICLGLITNKIKIKNINIKHLRNLTSILLKSNAKLKIGKKNITAYNSKMSNINVTSGEYPMLSTDIFPMLLPVMAYTTKSSLKETIYESRFSVANELTKLGVNINIINNECFVNGIETSNSNICEATDLRCAASLLIFAISLNKDVVINNFDLINRGYSDILRKLSKIGVEYEYK